MPAAISAEGRGVAGGGGSLKSALGENKEFLWDIRGSKRWSRYNYRVMF